MTPDQHADIVRFVLDVASAMGLSLEAEVETSPHVTWINLSGEGGEVLLQRRGEGLRALQQIVDSAFRRGEDGRVQIDCMGFRKGKDAELRQMARLLAEKVKATGIDQDIGPLNPYERRIVHLAVAEDSSVATESIGDAFMKKVIISVKK